MSRALLGLQRTNCSVLHETPKIFVEARPGFSYKRFFRFRNFFENFNHLESGAELRRLEADPGYLQGVLSDGAERAAAVADPIVAEVKEIVGFLD